MSVEMLATLRLYLCLLCCGVIATTVSSSKKHGVYRSCGSRYTCVNLSRCPRTFGLLHRSSDVTAAIELLRQHLCGLEEAHLQVCCPQTFILPSSGALVEDASVEQADVNSSLSVKEHPNIRLINQHKCGSSIKNRILGGEGTIPGEFPWLALLQYQMSDGRKDFLCGGSLISSRYVLTAAHCIPSPADPFKTLVSVRLGEYDMRTNEDCAMNGNPEEEGVIVCSGNHPRDYEIERTIPHPDFKATGVYQDDIALIRLRDRVLVDPPFMVPVCLPVGDLGSDGALEGSRMEVAGWRVTESGMRTSDVLLKVAVRYVSPSECERQVGQRLHPGQMCAGGAGPCTGDSGGPLMHTVRGGRRSRVCYQVGVVSVAVGSCVTPTPAVYTRLQPYLPWILDNLSG